MLGGAALLPDVDEPNSTISRRLPFVSGLFSVNRLGKKLHSYNPCLSEKERKRARTAARDAGHRGITHYFVTCAAVSVLVLAAAIVFREYYSSV